MNTTRPLISIKLKSLIFCSVLFFNSPVSSQQVFEFVSPDSALARGLRLHDQEKYKEAITEYKKISESDPRCAMALYEIALSFSKLEEHDSSLFYATKSIEKKEIGVLEDAFIVRGAAYDNKKEYKLALQNYEEALKIFPENVRIRHHIGISYYLQEDLQKAVDVFKEVNIQYAGYIKNQLTIAQIAAKEGQLTQSFLAYSNALLYSIGTSRSISILAEMDKLASKKYEENSKGIIFSDKGDNFGEIETLLRSQVALQAKYKISTEIDFPVIRQLHLLFSQLESYNPEDGYFDKYYVPFYKALMKEGYFPRFVELIVSSLDDSKIKMLLRKNESKIDEFIRWSQSNLPKTINTRELNINNTKVTLPCVFSKGEKRCGEVKNDKAHGKWYYFFSNGNLSHFGDFNEDILEGSWIYFFESGKKSAEFNFVNNRKDGAYQKFYESGKLKEKGIYKNDSLDGEQSNYYESGKIHTIGSLVNNKYDGEWREYYTNGSLKNIYHFKEDELEGENISYAIDGKTILKKFNYHKGLFEGNQKSYYDNGRIYKDYNYKKGKKFGEYKEYFLNGVISEDGIYEDDNLNQRSEYYINGNLRAKYDYENGELIAINIKDFDGFPFSKLIYKNDIVRQVIYYNKNGEELSKESISKNSDYTSKWFYSNNDFSMGNYKRGKKEGLWRYYNINGSVDLEENYKNGVLNGVQKTFNEQGKIVLEYEMRDDKKHGYWRKYNESGDIIQEGFFQNDKREGVWYKYYVKGVIKEKFYYSDDELEGQDIEYDPSGNIDEIYYFKAGDLVSIDYYDKNQKVIQSFNVNQELVNLSPNSNFEYAGFKRDKKLGKTEGLAFSEPINGIYDYKCNYLANEYDGQFEYFYKNGVKSHSSTYCLGSKNGPDTFFYINGSVYSIDSFILDNSNGNYHRYYYNGNKFCTRSYALDNRNSDESYYGINGELILKKHYNLGYLNYIVKNNNSGEFVDTILVQNETIKIEAKFKNGLPAFQESIELDNLVKSQIFDDKGTLLYSLECDNNGEILKKEYFYTNGNLLSQEHYYKGLLNGESIYKREDGTLILSEEYKFGVVDGNVKVYDDLGQLKHHLLYKNGGAYEKVQ